MSPEACASQLKAAGYCLSFTNDAMDEDDLTESRHRAKRKTSENDSAAYEAKRQRLAKPLTSLGKDFRIDDAEGDIPFFQRPAVKDSFAAVTIDELSDDGSRAQGSPPGRSRGSCPPSVVDLNDNTGVASLLETPAQGRRSGALTWDQAVRLGPRHLVFMSRKYKDVHLITDHFFICRCTTCRDSGPGKARITTFSKKEFSVYRMRQET